MRKWIDRLMTETISARGLALFRILYSLVLFAEVWQLYVHRRLVFDPVPYLQPSEVNMAPALLVWMGVIALLVVGYKTRTMAVANYCFNLATFSSFSAFEYHIDYIYTAVNLLLIFLPSANCWSVDAVLAARQGHPLPAEVSRLYRDAVLFCGIALVYFDSVLYKLASPMWRGGLGVWLPASYPHATWLDISPLLDNRLLMVSLSHGTVAFETLFIVAMWYRRLHPWLCVVGLGLHLGIFVAFPIPLFALAVAALYVLLIPASWLGGADRDRVATAPAADDVWRRRAVFAIVGASFVFQLPSLYTAPAVYQLSRTTSLERLYVPLARILQPLNSIGQSIFGTRPHALFVDGHFAGYNHEVALIYKNAEGTESWLPVIRRDGRAGALNSGRLWANWTFRVCGPQLDTRVVRSGVIRWTAFWANQQGVSLDDASFQILARQYDVPRGWELGFSRRQSEKPWMQVGSLQWVKHSPKFEFRNPDDEQSPLGSKMTQR
jgi:hypothetical protein